MGQPSSLSNIFVTEERSDDEKPAAASTSVASAKDSAFAVVTEVKVYVDDTDSQSSNSQSKKSVTIEPSRDADDSVAKPNSKELDDT